MPTSSHISLTPRKQPRQKRALVTVNAIFEATIQVLVSDGPRRLTTTRVADRAGVSVGSMYQYFPHKQALFYALNERYLVRLAEKIEAACEAQHGAAIEKMVDSLVMTYWCAKTERPEVTRALYQSVAELDNQPLITAFAKRIDIATATMLKSASNASFTNLPIVTLTLLSTIFGTVRSVFEREIPSDKGDAICKQLAVMCIAYLNIVE
ncbi:TetR family transcriptional regulator [Rahnella sp. AA]|uniref:TetR/AcrR family transcriptional regulator n=1 Tax=Rahnella sp. AA TaxID=2057180 RepID=UPI000C33B4C8|nr:TetR/AcrR family transcriptional regulator [Rahnella sp. AA]PKE28058.1 TetR family transcriptional regulator [Rahnella sp. AA]